VLPQSNVNGSDVDVFTLKEAQCRRGIPGDKYFVTLALQASRHCLLKVQVIFDDQHPSLDFHFNLLKTTAHLSYRAS
jgi:hypothetical protein